MPNENKKFDGDFEENGTPRWFTFIYKGPHLAYSEGPLKGAEGAIELDWPLPQTVRFQVYARRNARTPDGYGEGEF